MLAGTLTLLVAILVAFIAWIVKEDDRRAGTWSLVTSGTYDRVEYGFHVETSRSGALAHSTSSRQMDDTVVFFTDGRTVVLAGRRDVPVARGEVLYVYENENGRRRIAKE